MKDIEQLKSEVDALESECGQLRYRMEVLREKLSKARHDLAYAKRRQKLAKPPRPEAERLTEALRKVQDLRVAASDALRKRGATIAEVESVIGVSYDTVRSHMAKLERETWRAESASENAGPED